MWLDTGFRVHRLGRPLSNGRLNLLFVLNYKLQHFPVCLGKLPVFVMAFEIGNADHLNGTDDVEYRMLLFLSQPFFTVIPDENAAEYLQPFPVRFLAAFRQNPRCAVADIP